MGTKWWHRGPEPVELSDELAWRVHETAKGWISQVDAKATAALAIEAASLGFALIVVTNPGLLGQLTDLARWLVGGGLVLLFVSVFLSALVLLPRIRLREKRPANPGYLYFGDLRHWDKRALADTLARNEVSDSQIAGQVIELSKTAWRKHRRFQWSLYSLFAGMAVIGGVYLALIVGLLPSELGEISPTPHPTGVANVSS